SLISEERQVPTKTLGTADALVEHETSPEPKAAQGKFGKVIDDIAKVITDISKEYGASAALIIGVLTVVATGAAILVLLLV
ncbi:MAG TPA: hypothetical protein VMR98_02800, partial [Candidatus Polarisedimenticolaceae bacterium]|nr:hypothetical protein [Candidatus Polarisedimenticolaceae bacterium]